MEDILLSLVWRLYILSEEHTDRTGQTVQEQKMTKKKVLLFGHSPLQNYNDVEIPWADVWITLKRGRTKEFYAPCLCSRANLEGDLEITKKLLDDESKVPNNKNRMSADVLAEFEDEVKDSEDLLEKLKTEGILVSPLNYPGEHLEDIYNNKELINKKDAEEMLLVYLAHWGYNPENIKFKWIRSKHGVAWPA